MIDICNAIRDWLIGHEIGQANNIRIGYDDTSEGDQIMITQVGSLDPIASYGRRGVGQDMVYRPEIEIRIRSGGHKSVYDMAAKVAYACDHVTICDGVHMIPKSMMDGGTIALRPRQGTAAPTSLRPLSPQPEAREYVMYYNVLQN